jgi:hypothetical protein
VLRRGGVALWMPLELLRERIDGTTNWSVTSDSIALGLAQRLNAERLVVVKSCPIDPERTLDDLVADEVLDAAFAVTARRSGLPIDLLSRDEAGDLHSLLLQGHRPAHGLLRPPGVGGWACAAS